MVVCYRRKSLDILSHAVGEKEKYIYTCAQSGEKFIALIEHAAGNGNVFSKQRKYKHKRLP